MTIVFVLLNSILFAQEKPGCGTKLSKAEDIEFQKAMLKMEQLSNDKNLSKLAPPGPYVIPIVFHMLTHGINNNINTTPLTKSIMKCRIDDVLNTINGDFNGTLTPTSSVDPRFQSIRSTLNIQFVLATVDPEGNLMETPGLDWQADAGIQDGYDPKLNNYYWYGKNGKYYLDIVIVDYPNPSDGQYGSGHAFLPVQNVVPHITYNHRYIGTTCGSNASAQFAKEMSHELGHYFGLRHTFENGCTAPGDGISDTPPTTSAEGCSRNTLNSCSVYANFENLMDYNVNCQSMFTTGQTTVMENWLNDLPYVPNYSRKLLWSPSNLIAVGITPSAPIARIGNEGSSICSGENIQFKSQSIGLPTTYNWVSPGGTPSSSTISNPVITYNTPGIYSVTLTVSNGQGSNTVTQTNYIRVSSPNNTNITETFSGVFPPEGWKISNPDGAITFEKRKDVGNGDTSCMIINNTDYAPGGQIDTITLPYVNLNGATNSEFYFDVAYKKFDNNSNDILKVQISTNCGTTWTDLYTKSLSQLETTNYPTLSPNSWIPTSPEHWRREFINLSSYIGSANVSLRFQNTTGFGTRIWIDNVNLIVNQAANPTTEFKATTTNVVCSNPIQFLDETTGNPSVWSWSFPGGIPATSTIKNPTVSYSTPGLYSVTLTTSNANGSGGTVTKSGYIKVYKENLPYSQNFSGVYPIPGWQVINHDNDAISWEKSTTVGLGDNSSLVINNADNPADKVDDLILTPFNLTGITLPYLSFDLAYTQYLNATDPTPAPDKITISVSKDCGATWTSIYSKDQTQLQTVYPPIQDDPATPDTNETNDWTPTQSSDWRREVIFLGADLANQPNVLIKFNNVSGYGTRIWFDNLKIEQILTPVTDFNTPTKEVYCNNFQANFSDLTTGNPTTWQWSFPGGTPSTSTQQNPTVTYNTPGAYTVSLTTTNANGIGTTVNRTNYIKVYRTNIPYLENMSGSFPIAGWRIINPGDDAIKWEKRSDVGKGDTSSLVINNADNPAGKIDDVILTPFNFTGLTSPVFSFDLAYTQYLSATDPTPAPDKIDILVSKDCGANWTNVYSKNQLQLQTVSPPIQDDPATPNANETNDWKPSQNSDWRLENVNLGSQFDNEPNVLILIRSTSGYGTRIWFDNLNISGFLNNSNIENELVGVSINPNPAKDEIILGLPTEDDSYTVTIFNTIGQTIYNNKLSGLKNRIELNNQSTGIYFIKVESSNNKVFTKKIIKI
ncbi:MAG: PKD domain-containing protein [Limnohabitans sp.]|nr:PKD domain-containing protein [Limnohabitans sp.]